MTPEDKKSEGAAMQLLNQAALGYIVSAALNVALELGIADRLADGPRSTADLAKDAGVHEDSLYRVLRALASAGIFEERGSRTFALNLPASMLKKGAASLHDLGLWMTDPFHFRVYAETLHSVKTGQPAAEKVTGMPVFEYFAHEPKLSSVFNNAMTSWSGPTVAAALKAYDFSGIETLVDVAGGHGHVLTSDPAPVSVDARCPFRSRARDRRRSRRSWKHQAWRTASRQRGVISSRLYHRVATPTS